MKQENFVTEYAAKNKTQVAGNKIENIRRSRK